FSRFILMVTLLGVIVLPSVAIRSPLSSESLAAYGTPIMPYQIFGSIIQVNPNTLGALAAVLLFVHGRRYIGGDRRPANTAWLLRSVVFLIFSQSRTAWAGLLIAFGAGIVTSRGVSAAKKILVATLILALAALLADPIYDYLSRGVGADRLLRLSGRVGWWEAALEHFSSADLLGKVIGLGFMTANREILVNEFDAGAAATLHSDFVDALISAGVIGFLTIILAVFITTWRAFGLLRRDPGQLPLELFGVLLILGVRSFTGTTLASHNVFLVLFF